MVSTAEFDALAARLSNWGRWGADDRRGTLNLVTDEVRHRAAQSVVSGEAFSLAMTLSGSGPQNGVGVAGRINPIRTMIAINTPMSADPDAIQYNDDIVVTPIQAATHWDALSHVSHRGVMYNGIPADAVDDTGATRLGIEDAGLMVSRGILLDVARHLGVDVLPKQLPITGELLEQVEQAQGSPVESGDIVLIRTGQASHFLAGDVPTYRDSPSALDWDAPAFFHARDVAAVAIDNMRMELMPSPVGSVGLPVHALNLIHMGLVQGQNFVLEELGAACAADRRYTFLLDATPERFARSAGGMTNPVAVR